MKVAILNRLLHKQPQKTVAEPELYCQAPFKSLRLGPGGRVTVCCHNNKEVVGNYPAQSLHQIWEAAPLKVLRDDFHNNHYPSGCSYCLHEARESRTKIRSAALYDRFEAIAAQPVILDFKADNRCNLSCIMCSGLSSTSISHTAVKEQNPYHTPAFLEEFRRWAPQLREARFSGGEPFLSPFYFEVWKLLSEINPACNIVVQTNGTILNEEIKTLLRNGNFHINVSVDAFDETRYSAIRKGSSLTLIKPHLDWFRDYCCENKRFWGITTCAMQANRDSLGSAVKAWNEYGARGWFSVVWFPPAQALWNLPLPELEKLQTVLKETDLPEQTETERYNKEVLGLLHNSLNDIMNTADAHQHPEPDDLCSRSVFQQTILKSVCAESPEAYAALSAKIDRNLRGDGGTSFNKKSFLQMAGFASASLLFEWFEMIDEEEMAATLAAFVYVNNTAV